MNRNIRIRAILVLAILLLASVSFAVEPYQAKVIGISDGDTIKVLHEANQVRIRLYGIDTPEKRQAFGNKAKQFTEDCVFGKTVIVIPMDRVQYGLTVAMVQSLNETITLKASLIRQGYAWITVNIVRLTAARIGWRWNGGGAKGSGLGLWGDINAVPPWEFRRRK